MDMRQKRGLKTAKRRARLSVAAAAILIFVAISGTVYAASGGLDQFLSRFNPAFGALAIPPVEPAYAEDQGIRIEIVGAQQINNVVLSYMTMQDTTGENRLSEYTWADLEIYMDGQVVSTGGMSTRRLHFDKATNTVYFEIRILGEIGIPRMELLEIGIHHINCNQSSRHVRRFPEAEGTVETGTVYIETIEASGQVQRAVEGEWRIQVNTSEADNQVLIWTDIPAGDIHVEYMSLSPLGVQVVGTHLWVTDPSAADFDGGWRNFRIEIEVENRIRNIRPSSSGGGVGADDFDFFFFVDAPIDVPAVTAVIINGTRIPVLQYYPAN